MLIIVGSVAFNHYLSEPRKVNDTDAIADYKTAVAFLERQNCVQMYPINKGKTLFGQRADGHIYEVEIAWPGSSAEGLINILQPMALMWDPDLHGAIPPLDVLYALKMSHRYLRNSPHFVKTRNDILLMRTLGAKIPTALEDWYKTRERETYWYQLPNLNREKDEFFVDLYQYDHDTIHEAVAIYDRPAYTYYQSETRKGVQCSKQMFFEIDEKYRLAGVVEEATVLALERSLIPHRGRWSEDKAFTFALQKVCTSITSGWFREWSYEHYQEALDVFKARDKSPLTLLQEGLENQVIKENPDFVLKHSQKQ